MLRNAVGLGVSAFPKKALRRCRPYRPNSSMLLALPGGGWGSDSQVKKGSVKQLNAPLQSSSENIEQLFCKTHPHVSVNHV